MIKTLGITKTYNDKTILYSIDVEVNKGEISVIIGPSGGGKSTLIKCISLIERPDKGEVSIDNEIFSFPNPKNNSFSIWPTVTVVFQRMHLWPHLTLKKNILLPLLKKNEEPDFEYLDELIEYFDIAEVLNHFPNQSSVGQQQRVALIRALMLKPQYLLLDEITSAVDIEIENKILDHLLLLKRKGIGILLVTHLLGFAKKAGDKIYFLDNGQIIEKGGKELITNPKHDRVKKFLENIV